MHRRHVLAAPALLLTVPAARAAGGFVLVTEAQARAERERAGSEPDAPPRTRALSFPSIRIVSPQVAGDAEHASPLRIELLFETTSDARIVPASFRVLYGMLRIDLTDNVKQNAVLSEKGLLAEKAEVPKGNHRLFLKVSDSAGRTAEQELRIKVA
jgi:hypothetical protein